MSLPENIVLHWVWDRYTGPSMVPENTLLAGRVLCRWWEGPGDSGREEPPEALVIQQAPEMLKILRGILADLTSSPEHFEAVGRNISGEWYTRAATVLSRTSRFRSV